MQDSESIARLGAGLLVVLARVGAFFVFLPIPGARAFLEMPKVVVTLAVTFMLVRFWPVQVEMTASVSGMMAALGAEVSLGLAAGTGLALVVEAAQLAGQFIGLQAGFSYASTIDPASEADSAILMIVWQLLTSFLIFGMGLDHQILAGLAGSFERIPAGTFHLTPGGAIEVLRIGSSMFQIGLRLALPVVAVLLITDVSMALLGKVEQHMQLSSLLFPLKTLVSLAILATVIMSSARFLEQWLGNGWRAVQAAVGF